ncbi:MAG: acetylxylan esterase [Rikenellaceae bacterium]|nr:acetylxylan esterase [Rikenellaceae bacterium]
MPKNFTVTALIAGLFFALSAAAQPAQRLVRVQVAPDHTDWIYSIGEDIKFNVSVLKNDILLTDVRIRYEVSEDMMPPHMEGDATLENGSWTIKAGSMCEAGFLRCRVWAEYDGREYEGIATAAVDPGTIRPTAMEPDDFDRFWSKAKAELSSVPLDPIVTPLPERCTSKVDVYHLSLRSSGHGARVYGILCVPKGGGTFPAILRVPGAGIRPYGGDIWGAENGFITLQIGIHGIPVTMPHGVYDDLDRGPLASYPWIKLDDRDNYYYKRVYLGCIRALDYICSMAEWDGKNLIVEGMSQGGALSIVTAGLDDRVTALAAYYPALCDLTGYLHGRAGGWPHFFRGDDRPTGERFETVGYYDVVNFARRVKARGIYTFGYNDMVCPPTSMFSAYNVIEAPKELLIYEEIGHYTYPEQNDKVWKWILRAAGK